MIEPRYKTLQELLALDAEAVMLTADQKALVDRLNAGEIDDPEEILRLLGEEAP